MKYLIKINYKSGNSEQFWASKFNIETRDGAVIKAEWEGVEGPAPIFINISAIESIYQLEYVKGK